MRSGLSQKKLYLSLDRVFSLEPDDAAHVGQRGHDRSSHGGSIDRNLACFFLSEILRVEANPEVTVVELGAGRGDFTITACALLRADQNLVTVERDGGRFQRLNYWASQAGALISSNTWLFESRGSVPNVLKGDFARDTIPELDGVLSGGRCFIYCNNADGVWTNDLGKRGTTQSMMEQRLRVCRVGTVLLSFDKCFLDYTTWEEERYVSYVPYGHISWKVGSGDVYFYKYTKMEAAAGDATRAIRSLRENHSRTRVFFRD